MPKKKKIIFALLYIDLKQQETQLHGFPFYDFILFLLLFF